MQVTVESPVSIVVMLMVQSVPLLSLSLNQYLVLERERADVGSPFQIRSETEVLTSCGHQNILIIFS